MKILDLFYIKRRNLFLFCFVFCTIASFNVLKMGISSYFSIDNINYFFYFFSILVFTFFSLMFKKVSNKHLIRIKNYPDKVLFFKFFDLKTYFLIIFMMSMGIFLRVKNILSFSFTFFFYLGLGSALFFYGSMFLIFYFKNKI